MKNPLFSKTIQGILLLVLPHFLAKLGLKFDDTQTQALTEDLLTAIGGLWAAYGRFKAEVPLKNPLASDKLPLLVLLSAFSFQLSACSTLSPNQQAALKAVAKAAVLFGLNQLGDSVKEVRPYQPALLGVINATFSATDNGADIGNALVAGVQTVVQDAALREQVLGALKAQLGSAGVQPAAGATRRMDSGAPQRKFNAAIAAQL